MESMKEYISSNQLVFTTVAIIVLVGILLAIKWYKAMRDYRDDNLNPVDDDEYEEVKDEPQCRFFRIPSYDLPEDWGETFEVIVDRETKVQYLSSTGDGGFTPFIDSEGKPILYEDKYQEESE